MINKHLLKRLGRCLNWGGTGGAGRAGRGLARMCRRAACWEAEAEARLSSGAMAAGGLSRSERKAAERVRRLREEQQRERLRQVCHLLPRPASPARVALTTCPAPAGVAHPEEGGGRAQRRGGPAPGRERGPGDRAAGPEQAARGPEAAAGGGESRAAPGLPASRWVGGGAGLTTGLGVSAGVRRPGGAAEESPGAGRRRAERQVPGRLHWRGNQHGRKARRERPRTRVDSWVRMNRGAPGRGWGREASMGVRPKG